MDLMKRLPAKMATFGLLLVMALVNGCASTTDTTAGKPVLNLGPDFAMPTSGKSKVVFVRPEQFIPLASKSMHYAIHDGDNLIGILADSTYFVYECDAGHHFFSCSMQDFGILEGDLLPNRIYYVRVHPGWQSATFVEMISVYPGCPKNLWKKLPAMLRDAKETVITPEEIAHDKTGMENYHEHMNARLSEPSDYNSVEKILPEYGQAIPISLK
jgi:hypothetical protein